MVKYFRTTRSRKLLPQDALCAPISEVLTEGFVLCQSRNIPAASFLNSGCDQRILLTANQRDYIATYSKQWISRYGIAPELCPCAFFNLTDNPERRLTWTSAHMKLPAFRTNSTLIWSPAAGRCLTRRERLACMGYAVYPQHVVASCSPYLPCSDQHSQSMVGNAMHVANIGCAIAVGMACCTRM